ncbi:MAG: glycosyltransferase family 4 protein [Alcaligenaceae bacterium]|jgi:glycosyltransferase involved in cell wall biosynthesis|nr:glycosyltransferase family 4 protein [Alcaligenaceae bacterium]
MKILVITNLYPPFYLGGYELGCKNIVDGLAAKGHDVVVLTSPSHVRPSVAHELDEVSGCPSRDSVLRRLQLRSFQPVNSAVESVRKFVHFESMVSNFTNTCAVLDAVKDFRPEVVYLFNLVGVGGLAIVDALNAKGIPWLMHLMDRMPETLQSGIDQSVLSVFNAYGGDLYNKGQIISMTKHLIDEIESLSGFEFTNQIKLVPGWAKTEKEIFRREYSCSGDYRFVTAGAVQPHKGIDVILDASALLKAQGVKNFTVEIYGDGNVGHYVDVSKQLNIADAVTFCGSRTQDELSEIYKQSDAFLFPTWEREPFGFAPVEAAAWGCIPIVTSTCGVAERLIHNVNSLKIERNADSLSSIMRKFCAGEIDCQRIGFNAQLITRDDMSFDFCLNQIEDSVKHTFEISNSVPQEVNWRDFNLAYLKHNLALRMYL